jgi:hypothetical protein
MFATNPRPRFIVPRALAMLAVLTVAALAPARADDPALPPVDLSRYTPSEPIQIHGGGDHVIENRLFRPPAGTWAIRIDNHRTGSITIRNCLFQGPNGPAKDGLEPGNGSGVLAWQSNNIRVENCRFEAIQHFAVRIMGSKKQPSSGIQVVSNQMQDLQAEYEEGTEWGWLADGVQFIRVKGAGNVIRDNVCVNRPGSSYLTDYINVYCSEGTSDSPLLVEGNTLKGAGAGGLYNQYGCGIQLLDHPPDEEAGAHVRARDNLLIQPGIVGININGGRHVEISDNTIAMASSHRTNLRRNPEQPAGTWAALTLFNYSGGISSNSDHTIVRNRIAFDPPGGTALVNQTPPPRTVIADNVENATLDLPALLAERLRPRLQP